MLPRLELGPPSQLPLYRQLHEQLKAAILAGRMVRGERLPPTRELAGSLGLNRTTVAAAYELLESEGLIRGHVGRGSFVEGPGARSSDNEADHKNDERLDWEALIPSGE